MNSVGSNNANSSNSNSSNSSVASSGNAIVIAIAMIVIEMIAIETGMAGVMEIATTTGASVTGDRNSNNAPNAIVRTGSDARAISTSDNVCSSSSDA